MNPIEPSKQSLREQLLDEFTIGAPSYNLANDAVQANARSIVDRIMELIAKEQLAARIDVHERYANIAHVIGTGKETVKLSTLTKVAKQFIAALKAKEETPTRPCHWCNKEVQGNGWGINHNFCSLECKRAADD